MFMIRQEGSPLILSLTFCRCSLWLKQRRTKTRFNDPPTANNSKDTLKIKQGDKDRMFWCILRTIFNPWITAIANIPMQTIIIFMLRNNDWLIDRLMTDRLMDWLIDWVIDWVINWLDDWLIDWLIYWLIRRKHFCHFSLFFYSLWTDSRVYLRKPFGLQWIQSSFKVY